jgi:hypothetical protein
VPADVEREDLRQRSAMLEQELEVLKMRLAELEHGGSDDEVNTRD